MNKEFIYFDKKVVLNDDGNISGIRNYQDNIYEVLSKQNDIEEIDNRIEELKEDILEKSKKPKLDFITCLSADVFIEFVFLLASIMGKDLSYFVGINEIILPILGVVTLSSGTYSLIRYMVNKKAIDSDNEELEELNKQLDDEIVLLNKLDRDKRVSENSLYKDGEIIRLPKSNILKRTLIKKN